MENDDDMTQYNNLVVVPTNNTGTGTGGNSIRNDNYNNNNNIPQCWNHWFAFYFSPENSPNLWGLINSIIVLYSLILLWIIVCTDDDSKGYEFAQNWYLTYCVVTCLFWLLEITLDLNVTYQLSRSTTTTQLSTTQTQQQQQSSLSSYSSNEKYTFWRLLARCIEWVLALIFLAHSSYRIIEDQRGNDPKEQMEWIVIFCIVAYIFVIIVNYNEFKTKAKTKQQRRDGFFPIGDVDVDVIQQEQKG